MSAIYTLHQYSSDPWNARFEDPQHRLAFTVNLIDENPNLILTVARQAPWAQQHPDIMGPGTAYFYFGPNRTPGHIIYGNSIYVNMPEARQQKKESSTSRYFVAQGRGEYKWKPVSNREWKCLSSKGKEVATWKTSDMADPHFATLTLEHAALPVITEIVTTLTLNRIAQVLSW